VLALRRKVRIKGIANITGGAFYDKIPRIIPKGMAIEIAKESWKRPWIFDLIKKKGNIDDREMYRALNMGIGMVLVIDRQSIDKAQKLLRNTGLRSHIIGRVLKGDGKVEVL
jgi:phosphoribosylformylglycinamidine cyclo-ligase